MVRVPRSSRRDLGSIPNKCIICSSMVRTLVSHAGKLGSIPNKCSVCSTVVSMAAFQAVDTGSIPVRRSRLWCNYYHVFRNREKIQVKGLIDAAAYSTINSVPSVEGGGLGESPNERMIV
jgi:hypothetical protein